MSRQSDIADQVSASDLRAKWPGRLGDLKAYKLFRLEKEEPPPRPVLAENDPLRRPTLPSPGEKPAKRQKESPQEPGEKPLRLDPFSFVSGTIRSADSGRVTSLSGHFEQPQADLLSVTAMARNDETGLVLVAYFWFTNRLELSLEITNIPQDPLEAIQAFAGEEVIAGGELAALALAGNSIIMASAAHSHPTTLGKVPLQRGLSFHCTAQLPATIGAWIKPPHTRFDLAGLVAMIDDTPNPPLHLRSSPPVRLELGRTVLTDCFIDIAVPAAQEDEDPQLRVALGGLLAGLEPPCSPSGEKWWMWSDLPAQGDLYAFRLAIPSTQPVFQKLELLEAFIPATNLWLKALPGFLGEFIKAYRLLELTSIFNARTRTISSTTLEILVVNPLAISLNRKSSEPIVLEVHKLHLKWLVGLPESGAPQVALEADTVFSAFGARMEGRMELVSELKISASVAAFSQSWVQQVIERLGLARDPARSKTLQKVEEVLFTVDSKRVALILVDSLGSTDTFAAPR